MKTKIKIISLSFSIVLLGFLREYLFGNINWIYLTLINKRANQARKEFYYLLEWTPNEILIYKWILTFIFLGLFCLITYLIIRIQFQNKIYSKAVILVFAGLLASSGLFYTIGVVFSVQNEIYPIVRTLMGLGQSFMPLMFLFILFKFFPTSKID
ncbi:MAG: hypothetical protein ACI857_000573 [Arenicella sp.]